MKYKVLVLDLDGTLTNSKKKITDYTKKILLNLQKKGVHIVLASGRPEYGIWPIARELELEKYGGYILAFNGGKIVECSTKKTIFERTIEYSYVQEIYEQVKDKKVALLTYENDSLITETPKANRLCNILIMFLPPSNFPFCCFGIIFPHTRKYSVFLD